MKGNEGSRTEERGGLGLGVEEQRTKAGAKRHWSVDNLPRKFTAHHLIRKDTASWISFLGTVLIVDGRAVVLAM